MIKTTRKMRNLYAKHLNQYVDYENDEYIEKTCYLCQAVSGKNNHPEDGHLVHHDCPSCPLNSSLTGADCTSGLWVNRHWWVQQEGKATTKQAKSRMNWIIEQIHKYTDCEIVDDV